MEVSMVTLKGASIGHCQTDKSVEILTNPERRSWWCFIITEKLNKFQLEICILGWVAQSSCASRWCWCKQCYSGVEGWYVRMWIKILVHYTGAESRFPKCLELKCFKLMYRLCGLRFSKGGQQEPLSKSLYSWYMIRWKPTMLASE